MSATPPRADLRTLAKLWADTICGPAPTVDPDDPATYAERRDWAEDHADETQSALVGLAAVLPEHRRTVLAEAAEALGRSIEWQREHYGTPSATADRVEVIAYGRLFGLEDALGFVRRLAEAAPPDGPSATVPAENAPAVPEGTPGGFHEPDEPTDHIAAVFDAGTHGRTAPPRGQTRRLDMAAALSAAERDVIEKAQEWRRWFRLVEVLAGAVVSGPTRALIAAVDALPDAGIDQTEDTDDAS